jgi:hypothetical protein
VIELEKAGGPIKPPEGKACPGGSNKRSEPDGSIEHLIERLE